MVAELLTAAVFIVVTATEIVHARRAQRSALLSFGPSGRPAAWARPAPFLRVLATAAVTWGLLTLLLMPAKAHKLGEIPENESRNLLLVLDVSPSMRLEDAGTAGKQARRARAADVLKSFFERSPIELYKLTVLATYNGAKPVVVGTRDMEIVRNILNDLPMEHAFKSGPTDLFSGLEEAAKMAKPWRPKSTLVMIVSDGDTVPANGIPKMPDSVSAVVVVGVGDPVTGKFIDGHHSRQDMSSLRQIATRLNGVYHNANDKHLPTDLIRTITTAPEQDLVERLTRREYALMAVAAGAAVLALLPICLQLFGTRWRPGVSRRRLAATVTNDVAKVS